VVVEAPESLPTLPSRWRWPPTESPRGAHQRGPHSDAKLASVQLTADNGSLTMIISDNGSANGPWSPGLGLSSIQLRASEVGGACEAGPTAEGGRVTAVLPLGTGR
jgi:signal transduction histidine kinase